MNKATIQFVLNAMIFSFCGLAWGDNKIDVVTSISVGMLDTDYTFSEDIIGGTLAPTGMVVERTFASSQVQSMEVGVTVVDNNIYYGFTSLIAGQSNGDYREWVGGTSIGNGSTQVMTRSSGSGYIGYSGFENIGLYGGYTYGKAGVGAKINIEDDGPFVGVKYTHFFGSYSTLTFDLSYSYLQSEINIEGIAGTSQRFEIDTNTSGTSLSLTWVRAMDRGRSFFVRYNIKDMSIAEAGINYTGPYVGTSATIIGTQNMSALSIGVGF